MSTLPSNAQTETLPHLTVPAQTRGACGITEQWPETWNRPGENPSRPGAGSVRQLRKGQVLPCN